MNKTITSLGNKEALSLFVLLPSSVHILLIFRTVIFSPWAKNTRGLSSPSYPA